MRQRRGGCNNRQIADAIYYPPPGIDSPRSFVRRPLERGIGHELVPHMVGMSRNLKRARPQHPSPLHGSNGHKGGEECSASLAGPGGEPADFRCSLLGPRFHSSSLASMKRISSFKACLLACLLACPRAAGSSNAQILAEERGLLCPTSCK